ncbi:MAG: hypothetical protein F6J93_31660 [Oscillatoria sp. SIO1A7]|nr:hypothetical protein [Oscillatoria sp. SIO1A7]
MWGLGEGRGAGIGEQGEGIKRNHLFFMLHSTSYTPHPKPHTLNPRKLQQVQ